MRCGSCHNDSYAVMTRAIDGKLHDFCVKCNAEFRKNTVPDVYWPGHQHTNENLTDSMGNPILLRSRRHKAAVMRELGVREVGDRIRGGR